MQLIRYGNLYHKCPNKANVYFLNITIISYIPQIHKIVFTIEMYPVNGWETLLLQLLFPIFFLKKGFGCISCGKEREDFNLLDYFGMGIIEEISFFFLWRVTPSPYSESYVQRWCKNWKMRCVHYEIYLGHSRKIWPICSQCTFSTPWKHQKTLKVETGCIGKEWI